MKAYHRIGTALLCAVLFFCAACSPTTEVTPAPTPEITPAPVLEVEPTPSLGVEPAPTLGIAPTLKPEATPAPEPEVTPASKPEPAPTSKPEPVPTPKPEATPAPTPKPTPAPAPEPTPTPALESAPPLTSWEEDPGQFILDNLNAAFSDGRLSMRIFYSASGPISTSVLDRECGQKIRDLFSAYDWEVAQPSEGETVPFDYFAVEIHDDDAPYDISVSTYSNVLSVVQDGKVMVRLYFSADGAENLSRDLAALCPKPGVQTSLVVIPVQETVEDTARKFMDEFFAVMKENGHITDGEVSRLTVHSPEEMLFDVRFRLKPAQPRRDVWTNGYSVDRSGWTNTIKWRVCLTMDEDGKACRLDWIG